MQLKKHIIWIFFIPAVLFAQHNKTLDEAEVNFLYNYYNQDGNHSPVTGGIGTEKLDCYAPVIAINLPFDTVHNINVMIGTDYYTSASSDRIDRFITSASSKYLSSASSEDMRIHADVSYTFTRPDKLFSFSLNGGYSSEFDVKSVSGGFGISRTTKNENTEFSLKGSLYHDTWKLIYPGEIRNGKEFRYGNNPDDYDKDTRNTATFSFSVMQVLTKKLHLILLTDFVMQKGILNTPFHRVYFNDGFEVPDSNLFMKTMFPENLPRERNKLPVGIRVNYYLNDKLTIRTFYRYYFDDFGMQANTASIELPVKVFRWLTVYPHFRYHQQTASKYFRPFAEHELNLTTWEPVNEFYTSDWDQAELVNIKFGAGFKFYPLKPIARMKFLKNQVYFRSIELRYSRYLRNDGLKANNLSFDFAFKL